MDIGAIVTAIYFFIVFFVVSFIVLAIVLATVVAPIYLKSRKRLIKLFRSSIRIDGYRLFLPEEMLVDIGFVRVKGIWHISDKDRESRYVKEVEVLNPVKLSTKVIELSRICDSSSYTYVYADRRNNVLIEAPGLIVRSGKFKGVIMLCIEPSSIPEKVVEVSVGDINENAVGVVKISRSGVELSLTWSFNAPKQKKMVYDEKQGVYRVVEEYTAKPRARGSRLEICLQTPTSFKFCTPLAKSDKLGTPVSKTLLFKIKNNLVFLHEDTIGSNAYSILKDTISVPADPIIIGYKPGCTTVKLVLDVPLAQDIFKEVEL